MKLGGILDVRYALAVDVEDDALWPAPASLKRAKGEQIAHGSPALSGRRL